MDWQTFFPAGTPVMALPNWQRPRVYVPADRAGRRWRGSGFLPAFKPGAAAYRLALRAKAAIGCTEVRVASGEGWALGDFVRGHVAGAAWAAVSVGTAAAARKTTARLFDQSGNVLGYVKCAASPPAVARLRQELSLLAAVPPGAGPVPVAHGTLAGGEAIILTPVAGRPLRPTAEPRALRGLLESLTVGPPLPSREHPGLAFARENMADVGPWTRPLVRRPWPVVLQHGDLAPWNLFAGADGSLSAIDWEYGRPAGFPHLDLAYYALHVAALVRRRDPAGRRGKRRRVSPRRGPA